MLNARIGRSSSEEVTLRPPLQGSEDGDEAPNCKGPNWFPQNVKAAPAVEQPSVVARSLSAMVCCGGGFRFADVLDTRANRQPQHQEMIASEIYRQTS